MQISANVTVRLQSTHVFPLRKGVLICLLVCVWPSNRQELPCVLLSAHRSVQRRAERVQSVAATGIQLPPAGTFTEPKPSVMFLLRCQWLISDPM
jgi:hypothetical protein